MGENEKVKVHLKGVGLVHVAIISKPDGTPLLHATSASYSLLRADEVVAKPAALISQQSFIASYASQSLPYKLPQPCTFPFPFKSVPSLYCPYLGHILSLLSTAMLQFQV